MSKRKCDSNAGMQNFFSPSPARPSRRTLSDGDGDELDHIEYREDHHDSDLPDYAKEVSSAPSAEDEVDPLDAFMAGINEEVNASVKEPPRSKPKREDLELEEEDPMESFLSARKDAGLSLAADVLAAGYDSDEEVYAAAKAVDAGLVEYDSDDNPIIIANKKKIEPLPPLDHSSIDYEDFSKNFYTEDPEISAISENEMTVYRERLRIRTSGFDVPRPIHTFKQACLDSTLLSTITKLGYERPMPIQCQSLPIILSGRDLIGIAKTGSGKTAAFVIPMLVHIMDQPELGKGEGPIGLVCAPTRELAQQICIEARKFSKAYGVRVSGVYGGMSKFEQFKELKTGCEVVIATPGRLIDMIKTKALKMDKVTYFVLDEADRMFDMGFEPQVRSITGQIRNDRQTLLFSATMSRRVERLACDILTSPVRVTVGEVGQANEDITQIVHVFPAEEDKLPWLLQNLPSRVDEGEVLIFSSTKAKVEEVETKLREANFKVECIHGDKDQSSRLHALEKFKAGNAHVLVATDVASRGLNITSIRTVINYDTAKDMDAHVHRIGRTGRAGDKDGVAITFLTQKEARFAGDLVKSLIAAGQIVSEDLMTLAMKDSKFRNATEKRHGSGKGRSREGRGRESGGGGGSGGGGRGKGTRGVDYGLGLGYSNATSASMPSGTNNASSIPSSSSNSRSSAMNAFKMDMTSRFRSSFVAASTNTMNASLPPNPPPPPSHSPSFSLPNPPKSDKPANRERRRPSGWDR